MYLKLMILPFLATLMIKSALSAPSDVSFVVSSTEGAKLKKETSDVQPEFPIIYEMDINSNISNRFAKTLIHSKVKNPQTTAKEATFSVVLPEKAFISEFVMEIGGKSYKAYVKEKEEAKNIYDKAVSSGQSAAHVSVSARHSNRFTVSINIEPEAKAAFLLTYEELLERKNNQYELILNIHPGQIVKDLNVQVNVKESRPLLFIKTPSLRSGNEINKNEEKIDPSSQIEIINKTSGVVTFHPDAAKQKDFANQLKGKESEGLSGQFVIQYDVERDPHGGEVLLQDGYFVHFFAPKDTETLPKNVFFILDTSGSMSGLKIKQLKDAMISILGEMKPEDTLSIVEFNSQTTVWNVEGQPAVEVIYHNYTDPFPEISKHDLPGPLPATKEVIEKAKNLINGMGASGGTYMIGGLETGLYLVKSQIARAASTNDKKQPIIIFLTDGQPNYGVYSTDEITNIVTHLNKDEINVPIFSLSFGEGADKAFLRKLSLKNMGFSRHIYEAADASLQLQEFYKQISSPLLSNVNFKYNYEVNEVTKTKHPILFGGGELVVVGKYKLPDRLPVPKFDAKVDAIGRRGPIQLLAKVETPVTSLERLWAYLMVKQTLEKRDATDDKTELTKKALDLALKYSFVTDVSSLVVVKPNATSAVDTEDASKPVRPSWGYGGGYSAQPVGLSWAYGGGYSASSSGGSRSRVAASSYSGAYPRSGGFSHHTSYFAPQHHFAPQYHSAPQHHFASPPGVVHNAMPLYVHHDMVAVPSTIKPKSPPKLEDSLHWLASVISANRTLTLPTGVFEIGESSLNLPTSDKCPKNPQGGEGTCTLIKDCPEVFTLLTDFDTYKQYFCPVQNKFAGVCCPKKKIS